MSSQEVPFFPDAPADLNAQINDIIEKLSQDDELDEEDDDKL